MYLRNSGSKSSAVYTSIQADAMDWAHLQLLWKARANAFGQVSTTVCCDATAITRQLPTIGGDRQPSLVGHQPPQGAGAVLQLLETSGDGGGHEDPGWLLATVADMSVGT
mmetsp:Transcript_47671/g.79971  ORF Transcript_47671/g.79971 Transcript_47671/m.79971 type:complete len:110 (+) Transcript_47671:414-743(+)